MNENIRDTVRDKATGLAEGAFDKQKGTALGELGNVASALRRAGGELSENNSVAAQLVSTIADRVEGVGRSLEGKNLTDVVGDVEQFARRNPGAFIGGAIALGFLASRFIKSSADAAPQRTSSSSSLGDFDTTSGSAADFPVSGAGASELATAGADFDHTGDGRLDSMMDRPFIAGMAAVAIGAIVGTIIRETDREHELFGSHRDRLARQAATAARQAVARTVATAASSVAQTASEKAGGDKNSDKSNDKTDVSQNIGGTSEIRL